MTDSTNWANYIALLAIVANLYVFWRNQKNTEKKRRELEVKADKKEAELQIKAAEKESEEAKWRSVQKLVEEAIAIASTADSRIDKLELDIKGEYIPRPEHAEFERNMEDRFNRLEHKLDLRFKEEREQLKEVIVLTIKASLSEVD